MRWHLWYTDIKASSGVSWQDRDEAAIYGREFGRHGVPIPCGHARDNCNMKVSGHVKWCSCEGPRPHSWYFGARVCDECDGFIDGPKECDPYK